MATTARKPRAVAELEADARADTEGVITAKLADRDVQVLPVVEWRSSARRALRDSDYETWAEKSLTPDGLVVWKDVDPTLPQIADFMRSLTDAAGESPEK